jgi:hypothetical protein
MVRETMIRFSSCFAIVGCAAVAAGCYHHRLDLGTGAPKGPVVYEEWHSYYAWGLIGEHQIDVTNVCPSGNATISRGRTFLNQLATDLTLGIYSPMTITIKCSSPLKRPATDGG